MLRNWLKILHRKPLPVNFVVFLGIAGMCCILLPSLFPTDKAEPELTELSADASEQYRQKTEALLTEILEHTRGVGRVQVLVTVRGSEQYHFATEGDSVITEDEIRQKRSYVTIGGSSHQQPLTESIAHPDITGVVVVCEGGEEPTVQEAVYHAVSVACGISTAQICVTGLAENFQ